MSVSAQSNPWSEITVGPANADIVGENGRAIQLAIDALAQRGGGSVRLRPGTYILEDSIRLRRGISLLGGDRDKTILQRAPLVWSPLALDADISQLEITPTDAAKFRPGMGLCLWDSQSKWCHSDLPLTATGLTGGVLRIHDYITGDRLAASEGRVLNYYPMILAHLADDVVVDGLTLQAAVEDRDGVLAGMRSPALYLWRSRRGVLRNLRVTGNAGDGLSAGKASIGTVIENCEADHNGYYGMHPGSHSAYCTIRHCRIHDNASDGLYLCWGVKYSEVLDNEIYRNGFRDLRSGISTGHKDTDVLMARNHVYENAKFGVCFRRKTEGNAAHRTTLRENVIENNGTLPDQLAGIKAKLEPWEAIGCGIHVSGMTKDLVLQRNTIRETRAGAARTQRHALVLAQGVSGVKMTENTISGHPEAAIVDQSGGANQLQQV